MYSGLYLYIYINVCTYIYIYVYIKTSLNRPTIGQTLSVSFNEMIGRAC